MVRLSLLLLLLTPHLPGFTQPSQAGRTNVAAPVGKSIVNQFEHLSVKDGLSDNSVNCILQDREGFMWFGTNDGLNKYDGYNFTVLKSDPNDPQHSFQNDLLSGLCEDHANRLWAVTQGGLHEINKETGQVIPHLIRSVRNADLWNFQHSVFEDSQHVLWISSLAGLARYEPEKHFFTLFPVPDPEATLKTVFEDPQHRLWVGTYRGLYLFDRTSGRYTLVPVPVPAGDYQPTFIAFHLDARQVLWMGTSTAGYGLFRLDLKRQPWQLEPYNPNGQINPFTFLNSLRSDADGIFWMATTTGLQRIDPVRNQVYTYRPNPNEPKGISSSMAQTVYIDRMGTLWVGTDNGIDQQSMHDKPFVTYQVRPNKGTANLSENKVVALLPDKNGGFWTSNGYTVYRPRNRQTSEPIPPAILGSIGTYKNYTQALAPDGRNGVWLGTWKGLYHFDRATNRFSSYPAEVPVEYMSWGPTGELWVGGYIAPESGIAAFNPQTHRYRYYKFDPKSPNGLPDQYVHGLLASRNGDVWIPFRKQGIARLHSKTGRFDHYLAGSKSGLNNNAVLTVHEDRSGTIWLGTQQGGINRFDAKTERFSAFTIRDGLPSNNIVGITSDQAGNLWISTDKGLCRFDPRTKRARNYQTTNGLPSNDFLKNAVFKQQNRLFFGTLNGVVHFNPDSIHDDTRQLPVQITELNVHDQIRPITGSRVTLTYNENFLSFSFAALTFRQNQQNKYAYQLVGVDEDWIQNGTRHFANYTNLPPGDYTFRVKASSSDGTWTENEAAVQVVIQPPWWATWWAYSLYILLLGGIIWGLIRFYLNRLRQQQELELNRREAEQLKTVDELKTRFFSNITHEFRTPLSLIISPVEKLLHDNRFDTSTRQTLGLMKRNADQLLRLINQLLDLSKLEAGRLDVSLMRGEAIEFVEHVVESFRQAAEQKNVTLIFTSERSTHDCLFDADKWEKILTNLLANAVKFTGQNGNVAVSLTPNATSSDGVITHFTITISDSGIGISAENLPHVFDRFYQVDTSRTRAYEGTGIGLSLVKELVELIGGSINVASQPDVGTTFIVTLPVEPVSANREVPYVVLPVHEPTITEKPPIPVVSATSEQLTGEKNQDPLVLIVEDNDELREFLAGELATSYQILRASDGEAGWQLAQTELPDIVISDVMMPRMDGFALTRHIKQHPDTNHIAVVLLTAKAAHQSRLEGLQEGADDYLAKPFHLDELQLRLRNLLLHREKLQQQYRQQLAHPDTSQSPENVQDIFLRRVYELLDKHLTDTSLNVDWMADELAMSRKTLYRKIHNLIQLSPNELIRQYRLRKAAELLLQGHTVAETAYRVGFRTPSYFTIVFKDFYQKTPTEFIASGLTKA
ncbi:response regulator [Spirosoma sp. BT702]|uniref:histidine kinase n=1 Tax=Spirosoma profusum TaxID=2771354 RepID=A0A926XXM2_9BACT|nr:hybrid sensor histidine kinase/response regulator transcription factor [Spirosoma profusum]MBD2702040.1 response regulator [Spirosoma profusum]